MPVSMKAYFSEVLCLAAVAQSRGMANCIGINQALKQINLGLLTSGLWGRLSG